MGRDLSVSNENPISAEGQLSNLLSKCHGLFSDSYEGMKGLESHAYAQLNVDKIKSRVIDYKHPQRSVFLFETTLWCQVILKNISEKNGSDSPEN